MIKILKHTWTVLEPKEKKHFLGLALYDVIISVADIASLAALLWIIHRYIQPDETIFPSFLPVWLTAADPTIIIAAFFLLFVSKNLIAYLLSGMHYRFIGNVAIRITRNNLINYQQAAFEEFIEVDSSIPIRKISFQPFEFCQYILSGIQQIITQGCLVLIAVVAIIFYNAQLFLLLFLILLPPVIGIFYFIKSRLNTARQNIRSSNERSFQHLLEALKGYVESNVDGKNDFFLNRYIDYRKKFSKHLFDSISLQNLPPRIIEVFAVLGLFILVVIANWTGHKHPSSFITIGAFMAAAYKIIPGLVKIINAIGQVKAYEFSVNDLVQHHIRVHVPAVAATGINSIAVKSLNFCYQQHTVIVNLNFCMKKGDFVAVTGLSGQGKTTLLNLLLGFLSPSNGDVMVNGETKKPAEMKAHWKSIAYVRQQPFFINDSILRNIILEEGEPDPVRLDFALKATGLQNVTKLFPEGVHKIITENGKNISGGQQQRIAIARALYKDADLLLLDEPFNELDETSVHLILGHLRQLSRKGKMILLVTHDRKCTEWCNKTLALDEQAF